VDAGLTLVHTVQPLWWGGGGQAALGVGADKGVSGPQKPVCLQGGRAAPFWSTHGAVVSWGRRDGVMAHRRQTGNLLLWSKGSLFPQREKAGKQHLF